jgi:hypothetical protein
LHPITILPTILGIFEIIYAAKLLSAQPQPVQPSQSIAAFEIACFLFGNVFSMVVGILALVFYNDVAVKNYFAQLNAVPAPAPAAPMSLPEPAPAPAEPTPVPVEPTVPQPEEAPEKPKRVRKVAK